jgi:hypothetical protein
MTGGVQRAASVAVCWVVILDCLSWGDGVQQAGDAGESTVVTGSVLKGGSSGWLWWLCYHVNTERWRLCQWE